MEAAAGSSSFSERQGERMKRLRDLHLKRNEARKRNHEEFVEEFKRSQLPTNWEARKRRADWILQEEEDKTAAAEKGEDYDRVKLLEISAVDAERIERKKRKKNPDSGFSDYEQATIRQYSRLVKGIKPDMEKYEDQKKKLGDAFYNEKNSILHGQVKDTKEGVDRMVEDLERQISKREKYSRRRIHNDDADIDYINERNMNFNKKLERFYGQHTAEIKQNLERGTAV